MKKTGEIACLLCCVILAGCTAAGTAESTSVASSYFTADSTVPLAPTETASVLVETATIPFTTIEPSFSPAQDTPSPPPTVLSTPEDRRTASPEPLPSAQAGTNIRHEGFGENAQFVIVLDPGHQRVGMSEKEPNSPATDVMKAKVTYGTRGVATRIPEYELNIAVALYTRDALLAKGYTVIMTHETADVFISNKERAETANDAQASVLLHLHANGSDNPNACGAMVICPTRKNPAGAQVYGESRRLSDILLDTYCAQTGVTDEYVWETDTMTGINWSRVPVATLEMGYMSNPDEDRLMATDAFRRTAADAIAQAIDEFLHS